ncbi:hypothetical protein [Streptosporangium minutum]|uniref:Secreted protein n=1 Tax=Streptosporangium minutum TaxID=569862 RepID=A0A243RSB2_9ACTN|nr:hypothetical protein [Streptosporangium minutum]OUC97779.1 hypothetical protein CA984_09650 [Streptosporangium minutum]
MITRRISAIALTAVCAAVPLTTFSASAAQADTSSTAAAFGSVKCVPIGDNELCARGITGSPGGYNVAYYKNAGSTITARFRLMCINGFTKDDNGPFSISPGQVKSFVFAVGNQGSCRVRMQDITNGGYYYSPYVVP